MLFYSSDVSVSAHTSKSNEGVLPPTTEASVISVSQSKQRSLIFQGGQLSVGPPIQVEIVLFLSFRV